MPFIDKEHNSNMLLIDSKHIGNVLFIDRKRAELEDDVKCASLPKFTELEDDAEYASLPKFTELVKKPSNLTKTRKEKPHCPISHFLARFVEPVRRPRFYFIKGLTGLTDGLAIGGAKLRGKEVIIGFSR